MADERKCSACGAPMAAGYACVKPPGVPLAKPVNVAAWRCAAPGCGLGSYLGGELTTTAGLKKIELKRRRRARGGGKAMATEGTTDATPAAKRWSRKYDACVACGTTERPHRSKGFCSACAQRARDHAKGAKPWKKREDGAAPALPRKPLRGRGEGLVDVTVALSAGVHAALVAVAKYHETTPAQLVADLVERRFAGAEVQP